MASGHVVYLVLADIRQGEPRHLPATRSQLREDCYRILLRESRTNYPYRVNPPFAHLQVPGPFTHAIDTATQSGL